MHLHHRQSWRSNGFKIEASQDYDHEKLRRSRREAIHCIFPGEFLEARRASKQAGEVRTGVQSDQGKDIWHLQKLPCRVSVRCRVRVYVVESECTLSSPNVRCRIRMSESTLFFAFGDRIERCNKNSTVQINTSPLLAIGRDVNEVNIMSWLAKHFVTPCIAHIHSPLTA